MELLTEQQKWYHSEYLLSDEWKEKSKKRRQIDGFKCAVCGTKHYLTVHHISYDNIGNENIETDLITLCSSCHNNLHTSIKQHKDRLQEIDKEWRDAAHEALLPVMEKYRAVAGEEYAAIATEFREGEKLDLCSLVRLIRETSGYKPGYNQVYCYGAKTSSYDVAIKTASKKRKENSSRLQYDLKLFMSYPNVRKLEAGLPKVSRRLRELFRLGLAKEENIIDLYSKLKVLHKYKDSDRNEKQMQDSINKTLHNHIFERQGLPKKYITEDVIVELKRNIFRYIARSPMILQQRDGEHFIQFEPDETVKEFMPEILAHEFDEHLTWYSGKYNEKYKDEFIKEAMYNLYMRDGDKP